LLAPVQQVAELNRYSKAFIGSAKEALSEWLKPDGKQVKALREKLSARRILVFVDDLDRADPRLVPTLLLGLRDVLDLPGFCFVLGFDEDIVSASLKAANAAWKDGKAFLDKIIDFSFSLEEPTPDHHNRLVRHHLQSICPWMNLEVIEHNADILPPNPRKLKGLVRNLLSIAELAKRHSSDEIQWPDLFFGQLVKLESSTFLRRFLKQPGNESLLLIGFSREHPRSNEMSVEKYLEAAISAVGVTDESLRARLMTILTAWHYRRGSFDLRRFKYYADFGADYPDMTWSELSALTALFLSSGTVQAVESAVKKQADSHNTSEANIFTQLLKLSMESRQSQLGFAADSLTEIDVQDHLNEARDLLSFVLAVLEQRPRLAAVTAEAVRDTIGNLLTQTFRWIHFTVAPYSDSRHQEREAVLRLAGLQTIEPVAWLELLLPHTDSTSYIVDSASAYAKVMLLIGEIRALLDKALVQSALAFLDKQDSNFGYFRPGPTARTEWFLFFSPDSPLWSRDGIKLLDSHLAAAVGSKALHENAMELFGCLAGNTRGNIGLPSGDLKAILSLPDVGRILWTAATSRSLNYRMQERLLGYRTGAIAAGLSETSVPIPSWLERRARELGIIHPTSP
jgi:hypothetical protein